MKIESNGNILLEVGDDISSYDLSDFSEFSKVKDRTKLKPIGRECCVYNKYGEFLGLYNTQRDAARAFDVSYYSVSVCCTGRSLMHETKELIFLDRGADIDERLKAIDNAKKAKGELKVEEYSLAGKLVYVWDSIKEVSKHYGYSAAAITHCTHGRKLRIDNHIFAYNNKGIKDRVKEIRRLRALELLKRPKCIPVDAYTLEGEFLKAFPSALAASKEYDIYVSDITRCCKKQRLTANGMIFLYPGASISERLELIKEKRK